MPKFVFKLEAVLRHRRNIEQERQRAMAVIVRQIVQFEGELRSIDQSVRDAMLDLRDHHLAGKLDMGFLSAHRRFIAAMQRKAIGVGQKLTLAQRSLDDARKALAEAAKERKIMEKLREKQHERWMLETDRKQMAELDEIGMQLSYGRIVAENDARNAAEAGSVS